MSSLALSGCSTVSSLDVSKSTGATRAGSYLNYSVPKSLLTIQVTAAPGAAQAPTATTPTGTLIDSSQCAVMTAEYMAAQTEAASAIATYGTLAVRLALMAAGSPAPKDTPKTLSDAAAAYVKLVSGDDYQQMMAENLGKSAGGRPDGIYDQLIINCKPKVAVSVAQTIVPETTKTFALKPDTNILYNDNMVFGVDANGFLTNGAPTSSSQVTAIASAIASDVGSAVAPGFSSALKTIASTDKLLAFVSANNKIVGKPKPSCVGTTVDTLEEQLADLALCDPANPAEFSNARSLAGQIRGDLTNPGSLRNLPAASLPRTYYATLGDFDPKTKLLVDTGRKDGAAADLEASFGVELRLSCSDRSTTADGTIPAEGTLENGPKKDDGLYDGIVVSATRACSFVASQHRTAQQAGQAQTVVLAQNNLWVQDSRYLTILPTRRGFLVQRSVAYTFAGGQPTGVTDNRPSEALAIVSFPGAVVGAFERSLSNDQPHEGRSIGAVLRPCWGALPSDCRMACE